MDAKQAEAGKLEILLDLKYENMKKNEECILEETNLLTILNSTLYSKDSGLSDLDLKAINEEWKMDDMDCSTSNAGADYAAGKIKRRRFSSARIQPTRIKKVMQSDEEIGRMVASVPVAIGSAMEIFAMRLLETAAQCVQFSNCRTLSPMHIRYAVMTQSHLVFLESLMKDIPLPKFSSDYLESQSHMLSTQLRSSLLDPNLTTASTPEAITPPISMKSPFQLPVENNLNVDLKNFSMLNQPKLPTEITNVTEDTPKRKRGRPRKVEKDRFISEPIIDQKNLFLNLQPQQYRNGHDQSTIEAVKIDHDRLLMPPPAILPISRPRKSAENSPGVLLKPIATMLTASNNVEALDPEKNSNGEANVTELI